MTITINDPREHYLVSEAIVLAIEVMSRLPDLHRPDSNIADLKELLEHMSPRNLALHQQEAHRHVDILCGGPPRPPRTD